MAKKRKGKGKKEGPICEWELKRLQFYGLINEIRTDEGLRQKWVKRRSRAILNKRPGLDEDKVLEAVTEFFERVEILVKQTGEGKPLVRISPRKVGGMHYTEIMDVDSNNLASCISHLIDSAAKDLIQGYQKASTLSAVFGDRFTQKFNAYVKKSVSEEATKWIGKNSTP